MMLRFSILLGLGLAWGTASLPAATAPVKAGGLPLVILLGDSIRMNYQSAVVRALNGRATVWAPKENCRDTGFMLANLDQWLTGRRPAVIHVNVGLHDMFLSGKTGKTRRTPEAYAANLRRIFKRLTAVPGADVVFALTTPVDEARQAASKTYGRVVRRNADVDVFNRHAREVAAEFNLVLNDLNTFVKSRGTGHILRESDGIHLSPAGCEEVGKRVAESVASRLSQRTEHP